MELLPGEDPADLARLKRLDERFASRTDPTPRPSADRSGPPPARRPPAARKRPPRTQPAGERSPAPRRRPPAPAPTHDKGVSWYVVAAVIIAGLALSELGVRLFADQLPPHQGPEQEIVVKADQIKHLASQHKQPDVVFLGPSTMDAGVNTTAFDTASKRFDSSYNAAMKGMTQALTQRWALRTVLTHLKPKLVVVDVQPTLLLTPKGASIAEANRVVTAYNYYLRQVEDAPLATLDRALSDQSVLIRDRADLQTPSNVYNAIAHTISDKPLPPVNPEDTLGFAKATIDAGGQNHQYGKAPDSVLEDQNMARSFRAAFSDKIDLSTTKDLLRALKNHGVQLVVVVMPVDMRSLVPMGLPADIFHPSADAIRKTDDSLNIPTLDYSELSLDPLEYHDKVHLADKGAQDFSMHLAQDIDGLCRDGTLKKC